MLVSGATGLVGRRLVPRLAERFATVRVLSRSGGGSGVGNVGPEGGADAAAGGVLEGGRSREVAGDGAGRAGVIERRSWDGVDPGAAAITELDAVVHLAGEPIFGGLPTAARRARLRESRVASTRRIVERIAALAPGARPRVLVCASAVGFYGDRGEEILAETAAPGSGFLAELCRDWEEAATAAEALGLRVVRVRIGVVLAREGGALALMRIPFSLGVGGRLGSGRQGFPWIHIDDLVEVLLAALEREDLSGAINAVAPESVRNLDLTTALARGLGRPARIPVPGFALRALLGPLAGELLGSRRVVPKRLLETGFVFRHPTLESALAAELSR
ncbi:MAG: TIGR01777 family protein [Deltaproteobacteria bacterium]|nr:TIGR01777 family protein [Deltaproteobacteria bacterium]